MSPRKPPKLKVLWVVNSKEELAELPEGEYEIVWSTRLIKIKGKVEAFYR